MTTLREAAQQALEALYINYRGAEEAARILKAALAEPEKLPIVEIETVLTVQEEPACCCGEPTAAGVVHRRDGPCYMAEPVQEPVAGRAFLERILAAMEGVIDVADRKTDEFDALRSCVIDLTLMLHNVWRGYAGQWAPPGPPIKAAQQFAAPPQRKPLTEEEIVDIWADVSIDYDDQINIIEMARAIEKAHGIGADDAQV